MCPTEKNSQAYQHLISGRRQSLINVAGTSSLQFLSLQFLPVHFLPQQFLSLQLLPLNFLALQVLPLNVLLADHHQLLTPTFLLLPLTFLLSLTTQRPAENNVIITDGPCNVMQQLSEVSVNFFTENESRQIDLASKAIAATTKIIKTCHTTVINLQSTKLGIGISVLKSPPVERRKAGGRR